MMQESNPRRERSWNTAVMLMHRADSSVLVQEKEKEECSSCSGLSESQYAYDKERSTNASLEERKEGSKEG